MQFFNASIHLFQPLQTEPVDLSKKSADFISNSDTPQSRLHLRPPPNEGALPWQISAYTIVIIADEGGKISLVPLDKIQRANR